MDVVVLNMRNFNRPRLLPLNSNKYKGLTRDATFGLRQRFFRERAIFKKVQSNKGGNFAVPHAESKSLGLREGKRVDIVGIHLPTNRVFKIFNKKLFQSGDTFLDLGFNISEDKAEEIVIPREDLAPIQFVIGQVGIASPPKQIRDLGSRTNYTAADFLVWKQEIKITEEGRPYVILERNEREYFDITPGDRLSITTLAVEGETGENIKTFFNNAISTTVRKVKTGEKASRIYIGNLIPRLGYDEGTMVQCIARPI